MEALLGIICAMCVCVCVCVCVYECVCVCAHMFNRCRCGRDSGLCEVERCIRLENLLVIL